MLPNGVRRLVTEWSIRPGERAVIVSADDAGLDVAEDLRRAGTEVARVVDLRSERPVRLAAVGKRGRLSRLLVDGDAVDCDLLVMSGGRQPAYSLLAQVGGRVEYEPKRGIFVPTQLPANVEAVGAAAGNLAAAAVPAASYGGGNEKCFVCICEDVTEKDVKRALAEGFDSIELAKRYTTATMGPCQGRLCHLQSIRMLARETGTDEAAIGTTAARPPWGPVELGLLAGRHYEPMKRTPLHFRHEEAGATMMWTGAWRRPFAYGDPAAEVRAVHESLGVIDVSTLGKIVVEGPDAAELLERLYPNRFADLAVGRIRYGVLTTDGGRIMDDGTVARLGDDLFYVTTTSTGSESVCEWFEWWNAVWGYDVEIVNVTGALGRGQRRRASGPRRARRPDGRRRLQRRVEVPRREGDHGCGRSVPRPADRLRRRAGVRAALRGERGRASLGRARRSRRRAVRARAAACPPAREGAHHHRAGHRLRVEPALRGHAVDRQGGEG